MQSSYETREQTYKPSFGAGSAVILLLNVFKAVNTENVLQTSWDLISVQLQLISCIMVGVLKSNPAA